MPNLAAVSRINVLTAIRDHDLQGAGAFLESLGFEGPGDDLLIERGKRYDARALLAYAHGKATGEYLGPDQVGHDVLTVLAHLEFKVGTRAELDRAKAAPAPRTRTPRAAAAPKTTRSKPEPVVKLCPTCFTQLSVTGTCDFCDECAAAATNSARPVGAASTRAERRSSIRAAFSAAIATSMPAST